MNIQKKNKKKEHLTKQQQEQLLNKLGLSPRNTNYSCHGQAVFYIPKLILPGKTLKKAYVSYDVDHHNGGTWKVATSARKLASKKTRYGTFSSNFSTKVSD
ncbi:toxin C-terminal domain-containing protein [Gemella morbillorum]